MGEKEKYSPKTEHKETTARDIIKIPVNSFVEVKVSDLFDEGRVPTYEKVGSWSEMIKLGEHGMNPLNPWWLKRKMDAVSKEARAQILKIISEEHPEIIEAINTIRGNEEKICDMIGYSVGEEDHDAHKTKGDWGRTKSFDPDLAERLLEENNKIWGKFSKKEYGGLTVRFTEYVERIRFIAHKHKK